MCMTDKLPPDEHAIKIKAALDVRADHRRETVERRLQERSGAGRFMATLSEDDWDWALEQISAGATPAHVMADLGAHRCTLNARAKRDPEFKERLREAMEDRFLAIAEDVMLVTRGVEGYSTGDVRRDELVAKYDMALARAYAGRILAEKIQIDATHTLAPVMLPEIALPGFVVEAEGKVIEDNSADPDA